MKLIKIIATMFVAAAFLSRANRKLTQRGCVVWPVRAKMGSDLRRHHAFADVDSSGPRV